MAKSAALALFRELVPNRRTRWLSVVAFWSLLGLVSSVVWMVLSINGQPYTWSQLLRGKFIVWLFWGAITPGILSLTARFSLLDDRKLRNAIWLTALSLLVTLGYMFSYAGYVFVLQPTSIVGPDFMNLAVWILWTHWGYFYVGYWLTVAVEHVAEQMRRTHEASLAKERLERELASARLDQVRSQMHPHFLFNTLNTISSQVLTGDRHQAYDLVSGLANYLRQGLLAGETQYCSLNDEIELVREYLALILARYPDRLSVESEIGDDTLQLLVPSLILQPLIENAVTHSVARFDTRTTVRMRCERKAQALVIVLQNSTADGLYQTKESDHKRTNLGLHATTERLRLLYAHEASLKVDASETAFCATLILPIRERELTEAEITSSHAALYQQPNATHAAITRSHR